MKSSGMDRLKSKEFQDSLKQCRESEKMRNRESRMSLDELIALKECIRRGAERYRHIRGSDVASKDNTYTVEYQEQETLRKIEMAKAYKCTCKRKVWRGCSESSNLENKEDELDQMQQRRSHGDQSIHRIASKTVEGEYRYTTESSQERQRRQIYPHNPYNQSSSIVIHTREAPVSENHTKQMERDTVAKTPQIAGRYKNERASTTRRRESPLRFPSTSKPIECKDSKKLLLNGTPESTQVISLEDIAVCVEKLAFSIRNLQSSENALNSTLATLKANLQVPIDEKTIESTKQVHGAVSKVKSDCAKRQATVKSRASVREDVSNIEAVVFQPAKNDLNHRLRDKFRSKNHKYKLESESNETLQATRHEANYRLQKDDSFSNLDATNENYSRQLVSKAETRHQNEFGNRVFVTRDNLKSETKLKMGSSRYGEKMLAGKAIIKTRNDLEHEKSKTQQELEYKNDATCELKKPKAILERVRLHILKAEELIPTGKTFNKTKGGLQHEETKRAILEMESPCREKLQKDSKNKIKTRHHGELGCKTDELKKEKTELDMESSRNLTEIENILARQTAGKTKEESGREISQFKRSGTKVNATNQPRDAISNSEIERSCYEKAEEKGREMPKQEEIQQKYYASELVKPKAKTEKESSRYEKEEERVLRRKTADKIKMALKYEEIEPVNWSESKLNKLKANMNAKWGSLRKHEHGKSQEKIAVSKTKEIKRQHGGNNVESDDKRKPGKVSETSTSTSTSQTTEKFQQSENGHKNATSTSIFQTKTTLQARKKPERKNIGIITREPFQEIDSESELEEEKVYAGKHAHKIKSESEKGQRENTGTTISSVIKTGKKSQENENLPEEVKILLRRSGAERSGWSENEKARTRSVSMTDEALWEVSRREREQEGGRAEKTTTTTTKLTGKTKGGFQHENEIMSMYEESTGEKSVGRLEKKICQQEKIDNKENREVERSKHNSTRKLFGSTATKMQLEESSEQEKENAKKYPANSPSKKMSQQDDKKQDKDVMMSSKSPARRTRHQEIDKKSESSNKNKTLQQEVEVEKKSSSDYKPHCIDYSAFLANSVTKIKHFDKNAEGNELENEKEGASAASGSGSGQVVDGSSTNTDFKQKFKDFKQSDSETLQARKRVSMGVAEQFVNKTNKKSPQHEKSTSNGDIEINQDKEISALRSTRKLVERKEKKVQHEDSWESYSESEWEKEKVRTQSMRNSVGKKRFQHVDSNCESDADEVTKTFDKNAEGNGVQVEKEGASATSRSGSEQVAGTEKKKGFMAKFKNFKKGMQSKPTSPRAIGVIDETEISKKESINKKLSKKARLSNTEDVDSQENEEVEKIKKKGNDSPKINKTLQQEVEGEKKTSSDSKQRGIYSAFLASSVTKTFDKNAEGDELENEKEGASAASGSGSGPTVDGSSTNTGFKQKFKGFKQSDSETLQARKRVSMGTAEKFVNKTNKKSPQHEKSTSNGDIEINQDKEISALRSTRKLVERKEKKVQHEDSWESYSESEWEKEKVRTQSMRNSVSKKRFQHVESNCESDDEETQDEPPTKSKTRQTFMFKRINNEFKRRWSNLQSSMSVEVRETTREKKSETDSKNEQHKAKETLQRKGSFSAKDEANKRAVIAKGGIPQSETEIPIETERTSKKEKINTEDSDGVTEEGIQRKSNKTETTSKHTLLKTNSGKGHNMDDSDTEDTQDELPTRSQTKVLFNFKQIKNVLKRKSSKHENVPVLGGVNESELQKEQARNEPMLNASDKKRSSDAESHHDSDTEESEDELPTRSRSKNLFNFKRIKNELKRRSSKHRSKSKDQGTSKERVEAEDNDDDDDDDDAEVKNKNVVKAKKKENRNEPKQNSSDKKRSSDAESHHDSDTEESEDELPTRSRSKKLFNFKRIKNELKRRSSKHRSKSKDQGTSKERTETEEDDDDDENVNKRKNDAPKASKSKTAGRETGRENKEEEDDSGSGSEQVTGTKKKKGFMEKFKNLKKGMKSKPASGVDEEELSEEESRNKHKSKTTTPSNTEDIDGQENEMVEKIKKKEKDSSKKNVTLQQEVEGEKKTPSDSKQNGIYSAFLASSVKKTFDNNAERNEVETGKEEASAASGSGSEQVAGTKKKKGFMAKFKNVKKGMKSKPASGVDEEEISEEENRNKNKSKKAPPSNTEYVEMIKKKEKDSSKKDETLQQEVVVGEEKTSSDSKPHSIDYSAFLASSITKVKPFDKNAEGNEVENEKEGASAASGSGSGQVVDEEQEQTGNQDEVTKGRSRFKLNFKFRRRERETSMEKRIRERATLVAKSERIQKERNKEEKKEAKRKKKEEKEGKQKSRTLRSFFSRKKPKKEETSSKTTEPTPCNTDFADSSDSSEEIEPAWKQKVREHNKRLLLQSEGTTYMKEQGSSKPAENSSVTLEDLSDHKETGLHKHQIQWATTPQFKQLTTQHAQQSTEPDVRQQTLVSQREAKPEPVKTQTKKSAKDKTDIDIMNDLIAEIDAPGPSKHVQNSRIKLEDLSDNEETSHQKYQKHLTSTPQSKSTKVSSADKTGLDIMDDIISELDAMIP